MRLTNLNCPQCDGQLYQQQDKFYCSSCGSAFNIDYDKDDVEYAKLITQAERTRLLMEANQTVLAKDQELRRAFETNESRENIKQRVKDQGTALIGSVILNAAVGVLTLIIFIVTMGVIMSNVAESSRKEKARRQKAEEAKIERLTSLSAEDIEEDGNFIDNAVGAGASYEASERIGTVDGNLRLSGIPQAVSCYFSKKDTDISLYVIYKMSYASDDTEDTKDIYSCILFEKLEQDETGHIKCDLNSCKRLQAEGYDNDLKGYDSEDQIKDNLIPADADEVDLPEGGES
ncbi:MAG: hypothetical protein K6G47_01565 [Clostridia bacterium]|nr:hypothetical protein [Clostridia bacterium]